jgi:hypothetical protein
MVSSQYGSMARLNCISQNSILCIFPVMVSARTHLVQDVEGRSKVAAMVVLFSKGREAAASPTR